MARFISFMLIVGLSITITGCAMMRPLLTPLERRALESRDLECSYDNAYKATITVLQDNGYKILNSDYQSGLIRATTREKPETRTGPDEVITESGKLDLFNLLFGSRTSKSEAADVTFTIEKYTDEITKMRIVVEEHVYNKRGIRVGSTRIEDPDILQKYYTTIKKEIFMREQLEK